MKTVVIIGVSVICLLMVFASIILERICEIREAELSAEKELTHD